MSDPPMRDTTGPKLRASLKGAQGRRAGMIVLTDASTGKTHELDERTADIGQTPQVPLDARPKLKPDVLFHHAIGGLVRVSNSFGKSFEVHEVEAVIVQKLDGVRTVQEVAVESKRNPAEVAQVI